ncbi:hypothetical protein JI435_303460, partial [Parastagonospora nodorum SN15]
QPASVTMPGVYGCGSRMRRAAVLILACGRREGHGGDNGGELAMQRAVDGGRGQRRRCRAGEIGGSGVLESRAGWGWSGYSASTAQLWAWRMVEHDRPSRFPAQAAIFAAYFGWMARRGADDALTGGFRRAQGPGLGWGRYQHAAVKDARTTRLDGRDSAETTSGTREGRHNKNGTLKDSKTQRHRLAHSHRQGGPTLC